MAMTSLHITAVCLLGACVVSGATTQFLPWKTEQVDVKFTGFGISVDMEAEVVFHQWTGTATLAYNGCEDSQTGTYWEYGTDTAPSKCMPDSEPSQSNSESNTTLAKIGGPVVALGLLGSFTSLVMALTNRRKLGGIFGVTGAAILAIGAVVFWIGLNNLTGELSDFESDCAGIRSAGGTCGHSSSLGIALYLGFVAAAAGLAGGLLLLLAKPAGVAAGTTRAPYPASARAYGTPAAATGGAVAAPLAVRRLKCPKCATIITIAAGTRPTCTACGYGK